jgi:hypothetical protein
MPVSGFGFFDFRLQRGRRPGPRRPKPKSFKGSKAAKKASRRRN